MIRNSFHCQIMRDKKSLSLRVTPLLAICLLVALGSSGLARDKKSDSNEKASRENHPANETPAPKVEIENFGKITEFFYRGAQPKVEDYLSLAGIGVKTIIDLRNDPKEYAQGGAEKAGLKYINFPLSDTDYPSSDTAEKFLKLVNDQTLWPVYIHCAGGRHRTGIMAAVYRLTNENWDIDRAYTEMKNFDFYTRWGHKDMKTYIFDYAKALIEKRVTTQTVAAAATSAPAPSFEAQGKLY
jgi:protein tyrosine/serine phosphatase